MTGERAFAGVRPKSAQAAAPRRPAQDVSRSPGQRQPSDTEPAAAARSPNPDPSRAESADAPPVAPSIESIPREALFNGIEEAVRRAVQDVLTPVGLSADDCPYIERYLAYYRQQPLAHVRAAVRRYARPGEDTLEGWVSSIARRAQRSALEWRTTGRDPLVGALSPSAERALEQHRSELDLLLGLRARLGPGAPLPPETRQRLEASYGRSLGEVRVHADEAAHRLADEVGATAFSIGSDLGFAREAYRPGTAAGDALIAHEAAHAAQQSRPGTAPELELEREADRAAGRAMLGRPAGGLSGGGLRLQRCIMPSSAPRDERTIAQVRADLEASGDLGPRSDTRPLPSGYTPATLEGPTPLSAADRAALAPNPAALTPAEMVLDIETIEAQLEQLEPLLRGRPSGVRALDAARRQLTAARSALGSADTAEWSRRISRTRVVLGHTQRALTQLGIARAGLSQPGVPHASRYARAVDQVAERFDGAVGRALQPDVLERFQRADQAASNLPLALLEADIEAFESLRAGAQLLQPAIREIHDWAGRLRPRLAQLQERARELVQARRSGAANVETLEARFRDSSEALQLSIEALSYWEQLLYGYGYLVSNPPPDMRAIDAIARLMTRVRHMRDADESGDVALLEVLVRRYREDEDVRRFLENLHVFVGFSRVAVSLGIVLIAAMASAGIGAAATAAIGTTTTTAGTVTAFAGVTALEALTFTAVSRGLQSVLPGQQTQGSFLGDLAWNFGLFSVMRAAHLGVARVAAPVGVPAFTRLVQHTTSYPLLLGYGALHHRISQGEWPSDEQIGRMAAETLILMAGFAVITGRFRSSAAQQPRELQIFRRRYGLEFEALGAGRQALAEQVAATARSGSSPDAARTDLGRRARILEERLRGLVDRIQSDPDVRVGALREAVRGFGSATEAFALQARLMEAGMTAPEIATIEGRVAALPELLRDPVRTQLGAATEYATLVLADVAARRAAIQLMARVGTSSQIGGFAAWVRFSTAQRPGVDPAQQARNFLDDVGELVVAEAMSRSVTRGQRVEVGGDARARLRPGTDQQLPSFDIEVTGGPSPRNVEVYSPEVAPGQAAQHQHLGSAIRHAADKAIADPSLPAGYQTRGSVEAAVRIPWPVPDRRVGGGTIQTASNGDVTLVQGNGVRRPMGNFFGDYVSILNGQNPRAGAPPSEAARVDALTVYSRAGDVLYRYVRDRGTNTWSGSAP